ncbi:MAG: hypothetical protein CMH30_00920 [Micavibrio sp.]|nr:hypothetical protein [Micavibrio sp.]|tara:strand:+ start:919 stop:1944 length:1026 start_codon:yes stop_codon:yes gene_type:complete
MNQSELDRFLDQKVTKIVFSDNAKRNTLARKMLYKAGIDTLREALQMAPDRLLSVGGVSQTSLNTFETYLLRHGMWLGMNIEGKPMSRMERINVDAPIEMVLGYTLNQNDITARQRDTLRRLLEKNIKTAGQLATLTRAEFEDIFPPAKFISVRRTLEYALNKYGMELFQHFSDVESEALRDAVAPSSEVKEVIQRQKDILDAKRAFARAFSGSEWREHIPAIVSNTYAMEAVRLYLTHESAAMVILEKSLGERVQAFAESKLRFAEDVEMSEARVIDAFQVTGKALRRHFHYVAGSKRYPKLVKKRFARIMKDEPTIQAIEQFDKTMQPHKQALAQFLMS